MKWVVMLLVGVLALTLLRIIVQVRRATTKREDDWDARFIAQLRKAGVAPFESHEIDFFFELPDERACETVTGLLAPEGFAVDVRTLIDGEERRYSLHARKAMRLHVPEMQALSKRFTELAASHGGKYDGWAVAR